MTCVYMNFGYQKKPWLIPRRYCGRTRAYERSHGMEGSFQAPLEILPRFLLGSADMNPRKGLEHGPEHDYHEESYVHPECGSAFLDIDGSYGELHKVLRRCSVPDQS